MRKWIYRILMIVCLGVFGYSAYNLYLIKMEQNQSEEANGAGIVEEVQNPNEGKVKGFNPNWEKLRSKYPDIVGWIYVPDCDCSYPVVQGQDNYFYLNHAANQEESRYGAVFMNSGQPKELTDDNTIVYGHSSDDGAMMTNLYNFVDANFFQNHPYFYYFSPEQNYKCEIYVVAKDVDAGVYYETFLDAIDYAENEGDGYYTKEEILEYWKAHALYSRDLDIDGAHMMTISTCNVKEYGFFSNQRLIIMGKLEPTDEPIEIKK